MKLEEEVVLLRQRVADLERGLPRAARDPGELVKEEAVDLGIAVSIAKSHVNGGMAQAIDQINRIRSFGGMHGYKT